MSRRSNFLEANDSFKEQNLRFVRNDLEENLNQYFGGANAGNGGAPPRDYKVVQPQPGFCIKTYKLNANEKYFINVCQANEIPAPEDITEEQLQQLLQSDMPSSYRVPMSLSDPRVTKDKSNNNVDVSDIAINPKFFAKIEKSRLFKDFFLALIAEALSDKYNVQISIEKSIILNNRKYIGSLVSHRVRNTDVKTVLQSYSNPSDADKKELEKLGAQIASGDSARTKKPLVQEIDATELKALQEKNKQTRIKEAETKQSKQIKKDISLAGSIEPIYKLRARIRDDVVEEIQAEFYLPKCLSSQEITLDVGEDRILLESIKHGYIFDKYVNYHLNQDLAKAIFDKNNKMLQIRIPVYPGQ